MNAEASNIKQQILALTISRPKHYIKLIKNNPELLAWVEQNTLAQNTDHLPSKVYSAVHQVSNICSREQTMGFDRWSTGFVGCGPAATCACTKDSIALKVSHAKQNYTDTKKQAIQTKREGSMVEKYGVPHNLQRKDVKEKLRKPKISDQVHELLTNKTWLEEEYVTKKRSLVDIAAELNVYYSTVAEYCKKFDFVIRRRANYSLVEKEIESYLKSLNVVVEPGNWSILGNKELDIVVSEKKLAIEVNGLYWHSLPGYDSRRHLEKTLAANQAGYDLFHVTDYEWANQQDIIKSMLCARLGLSNRVFARSTYTSTITTHEAREFFNTNHLQGFNSGTHYLALKDQQGRIVCAIIIGAPRFKKRDTYELIRFASAKHLTVVGGLSKLLAYAKARGIKGLYSYCDRSKSTGRGYLAANFVLTGTTGPGYFWTDGNAIISRYRAQKHKLHRLFENVDDTKSESEIMQTNGFNKFWDCGNFVFEITL